MTYRVQGEKYCHKGPPLQEGFDHVHQGGLIPSCFYLPPNLKLLVMVIILLPISWDMSLVFMLCSESKKVVSTEGYFMATPECEWLHSLWVTIN